jgi:GT2 family glycosyltransferase
MLSDRKVFEEIGGFDEDYFLYVEEGDLGLRFWLHGFKVMYIPTAVAYHELGAWSKGKLTPEHVFFYQKNMIVTIIKDFEFANSIKGLCILMFYDIVKSIHFLKNKELSYVYGVTSGLRYSVKELPKTLSKRRKIQKSRKPSDQKLRDLGLFMPITQSLSELVKVQKRPS